ncbi:hypothetical protein V2K52_11665 [Pseudomonas alliivorans]|uniref:hypothetical protein n=1 Tax=Pseudomonas alliivorans TaxID=2810613 RepID=UPI00211C3E0C|nr:hypothetical protein [Pseudomonas alliivorans]MCQ9471812.1 hypothetical protein [Pseudomonas alliivorans]MEE4681809.1 hypothetical protein [Pseudomonas alliivorans]MEE4788165.1 hypothetical protein [Pseudomonas alliivorans]MEE4791509.1 hypothetical protein [Pseudomonas alliivorans]MEE4797660.1 hypothetical protein [Pseudomonas alliivorans]
MKIVSFGLTISPDIKLFHRVWMRELLDSLLALHTISLYTPSIALATRQSGQRPCICCVTDVQLLA